MLVTKKSHYQPSCVLRIAIVFTGMHAIKLVRMVDACPQVRQCVHHVVHQLDGV